MRRVTIALLVVVLTVTSSAQVDAAPARFASSIAPLDTATRTAMTGVSWHPGCPVGLADLRLVTLSYWGFDGQHHLGSLVIHRRYANAMVRVFRKLYDARFPIASMVPIDRFGGNDDASTKANNTSAFNCRAATGSTKWSQHAYGAAVDINPLQNPYIGTDGTIADPAAERYRSRSLTEAGVIGSRSVVVKAFTPEGWGWGGRWRTLKDYQHLSANGR